MTIFLEKLKDLYAQYKQGLEEAIAKNPYLLKPEQTAIMCTKPFVQYLTSSRRQMVGSHISNSLTLKNGTSANIYTGYENEMAKTTYQIQAPCDMEIKFITAKQAMTIVVYYDHDTHMHRVLEIPNYVITGDRFGCILNIRHELLYVKSFIRKDTVLAITQSVGPEGDWRNGVELNTLAISHTSTIQDGICITTSARNALRSYGIGRKRIKIDKGRIPLNKYGNEEVYKPIPDIGDKVAKDRILAVTRSVDPLLAPLLMSPRMLRCENIDTISDTAVYVGQGEYNAEVIDIKVFYQQPTGAPTTPIGMGEQFDRYRLLDAQSSEQLVRYYDTHIAKSHAQFDGSFQIELRRAIRDLGNYTETELDNKGLRRYKGQAPLISNGEPIGEYEIEIIYKYEIVPNYGDKITNTDGTKGVITSIVHDRDAFRDSEGNVAHVLLANLSVGRRTNVSALMYPGLNAFSRDLAIELRETIKTDPEAAYLRLVNFYNIVSPKMAVIELQRIVEGGYSWRKSLEEAIYHGVSPDPCNPDRTLIPIYYPTDNTREFSEIVKLLLADGYKVTRSPLTYRNKNGDEITTELSVSIGSSYMIALDKIAALVFSSVSAARVQHHGMPAREPPAVRTTYPCSQQSTRIDGESEIRPRCGITDGLSTKLKDYFVSIGREDLANNDLVINGPVAEQVDRANNPTVMSQISLTILESENPLQIPYIVDRDKVPRGGSRALNLMEHLINCSGVELVK